MKSLVQTTRFTFAMCESENPVEFLNCLITTFQAKIQKKIARHFFQSTSQLAVLHAVILLFIVPFKPKSCYVDALTGLNFNMFLCLAAWILQMQSVN